MTSIWHRQHYNALAKEIRELYPNCERHDIMILTSRATLAELALSLAKRFKMDSENMLIPFDAVHFLNSCSPNPDLYPLAELWTGG